MSIAWMNYVWEHSRQKGTSLLMLLAIADHANDDGLCWPSVARLAHKARTTKRQAQRVIAYLEETGEILVDRGDGRTHTSVYQIKGDIYATKGDIQGQKGDISAPQKGDIQRVKGDISEERVTSGARKGDIAMSPDPSVTIIEPSLEPSADSDANASAQPAAAPAPPPSSADAFRQFQDDLKADNANRAAVLRRAYIHCYGDQDAPDHGRIGAFAKRVGGAGMALDLLWSTVSRPPNGDILAYLEAAHAARKNDRGQPRTAPNPRAFAVDLSHNGAPPPDPPPPPPRAPVPTPDRFTPGATLWDKALWELGKSMPADQFERILRADLIEYSGDVYELRLPAHSPWLDWLRGQAEPTLRRTLSSLVGRRIALTITRADAPHPEARHANA